MKMTKIRMTADIDIETASGPCALKQGDIIKVDSVEGYSLVEQGYAIPVYDRSERQELSRLSPEALSEIHKVKTLFGGRVMATRKLPSPFDVTKCTLQPSPYGSCHSFKMVVDKTDNSLSPFCLKAKVFCPHAESRKQKEVKEAVCSVEA